MDLPLSLQHETISIIAGGYTAKLIDLSQLPGYVIAVNDAAYYAPKWHAAISMDRLWSENRYDWIKRLNKPVYLRRSSIKAFNIGDHPNLVPYECDHLSTTFTDQRGHLDGTNSGAVAMNLAFQLRPTTLYLVGFDMSLGPRGERHWYPDYPWKGGGGTKSGTLATWEKQLTGLVSQLTQAGIAAVRVIPTLKGSPGRGPVPRPGVTF